MPRLFPSFSRSREQRDTQQQYDHYDVHDDQQRPSGSAWRRVIPGMKSREGSYPHRDYDDRQWEDEVVDRPNSYAGYQTYPTAQRTYPRHYYEGRSERSITPTEESYDGPYTRGDNMIPIVQRESSLTRLQEAFADHSGPNARPITELPLPQSATPRASPRQVPPMAAVPPPGPPPMAELRHVYPEQHTPILVPNMTTNSAHADVMSAEMRRTRSREPQPRYRDARMTQDTSYDRRPLYDDDQDYPPCVVVVERGRNGKKDTYYVIPGGAPVIFEDDRGNELTRVGDFSGRYKPRRQRPVIIEDEYGHEVGRLGFDDESSLDYSYRRYNSSDDSLYERSHDRDYRDRYRDRYHDRYNERYRDRYEDKYDDRNYHDYHRSTGRSHRSSDVQSRHSSRSDRERTESRPRGRSPPNVVFIPPSTAGSDAPSPSHHPGRSSRRDYEISRSSQNPSGNVLYIDPSGRQGSGSVSSGSSGKRSNGSPRRH